MVWSGARGACSWGASSSLSEEMSGLHDRLELGAGPGDTQSYLPSSLSAVREN